MRFAIISDIHANLPALDAVINDMQTYNIDHIICLGDIVGYGPFPSECLTRVREMTDYVIMGNHEAATAGLFDVNYFYDDAKEHILWTKEQLSHEELEYMRGLHYMLNFETFMISHGDFENPDCFPYIETEAEAMSCFNSNQYKLMFVGHTHIQLAHRLDHNGNYAAIMKETIDLNPKWRYIANPGSVGVSRDGKFGAGYLIFDSDLSQLFMRRVSYNLKPLYDAISAMARDEQHLDLLMERFKPKSAMNLAHQVAMSQTGIRKAVFENNQEDS